MSNTIPYVYVCDVEDENSASVTSTDYMARVDTAAASTFVDMRERLSSKYGLGLTIAAKMFNIWYETGPDRLQLWLNVDRTV